MKPLYMMKQNAAGGSGVYRTAYHPQGESHVADYHVKDNKIYAAANDTKALYEIRGNEIHTTVHNLHHDPDRSHVLNLKTHE
jgi:hypothetical protein